MSEQEHKNPNCFCRNGLVHLTIFPNGPNASYALLGADDGEIYAQVAVCQPVRGSDLSKMIPQGLQVEFADCAVFSTAGKLVIGTPIEFDTCVVTERAELTMEERLQRMELRDMRRQAAEHKRQAEYERWRAEQAEQQEGLAESKETPVIEPESTPAPQPVPEETTDA